jgi:hypothetical protein
MLVPAEAHQYGGTWVFYVIVPLMLCGVVASLWLIVKGAIGVFGRTPLGERLSTIPSGPGISQLHDSGIRNPGAHRSAGQSLDTVCHCGLPECPRGSGVCAGGLLSGIRRPPGAKSGQGISTPERAEIE